VFVGRTRGGIYFVFSIDARISFAFITAVSVLSSIFSSTPTLAAKMIAAMFAEFLDVLSSRVCYLSFIVIARGVPASSVNPTFRRRLDAPPFVPYIWRTKTPIWCPGVLIMTTPQRSLTGPLLLLNRLSEIESDLRSLLPTANKVLRSQLIVALTFVEKANRALQKSVEQPG